MAKAGPISAIMPRHQSPIRSYQRGGAEDHFGSLDVTVFYCPGGEFKIGARFSRHSFDATLNLGHWPTDMIVIKRTRYFLVAPRPGRGQERLRQMLVRISERRAMAMRDGDDVR